MRTTLDEFTTPLGTDAGMTTIRRNKGTKKIDYNHRSETHSRNHSEVVS